MDLGEYVRFLVALIFVITLIIAIALIARKAGLGFPAKATKPSADRRLSIVEVTPVDGRRRLVLVRRDDVEHLLLLGPTTETVIEIGIFMRSDTNDFQDRLIKSKTLTSEGKTQ